MAADKPRVSVIIPTYYTAKSLLLGQNHPVERFKPIVAEVGCTDHAISLHRAQCSQVGLTQLSVTLGCPLFAVRPSAAR